MKELSRNERLNKWAKTLDKKTLRNVIVELTEYTIDSEYVSFWGDTVVPYFDGNGENIDGSERPCDED